MTKLPPSIHGIVPSGLATGRLRALAVAAFLYAAAQPGSAGATGPDLAVLLDVLATTPEGEWTRVNRNRFSDVWTPSDLRPYGRPHKIIEAWSSFAWDSNRGDLIIYGGGHANYAGNDVYRWRGTTLEWERASLPSAVTVDSAAQDVTVDGPDHAPVSAHTYDNNVFLPNIDRFLSFGGSVWAAGGPYTRDRGDGFARRTGPYAFDPSKADANKVGGLTGSHVQDSQPFPEIVGAQMWQNRDIYHNLGVEQRWPGSFVNSTTAVTEEDGYDVIYVTGRRGTGSQQHLYKYTVRSADDPTQDSWEEVGSHWEAFSGQGAGTYDSNLNLFVRTVNEGFVYWDLNASNPPVFNKLFEPTAAGDDFVPNRNYGMDYDPVRDQYLLWKGGGDVWAMRSPGVVSTEGWTITRQPPALLEVPSANHGTGVLGKWKYIEQLDAFMGLVDLDEGNVWLYKPIGWSDPRGADDPGGPGAGNELPSAGFGFGCLYLSCSFADASTDADGTVTSWHWDFGDGASSTDPYPTHAYTGAGMYSVRLTVTDDDGAADAVTVAVTVSDGADGGTEPEDDATPPDDPDTGSGDTGSGDDITPPRAPDIGGSTDSAGGVSSGGGGALNPIWLLIVGLAAIQQRRCRARMSQPAKLPTSHCGRRRCFSTRAPGTLVRT